MDSEKIVESTVDYVYKKSIYLKIDFGGEADVGTREGKPQHEYKETGSFVCVYILKWDI